MSSRTRVAIVGAGNMAREHARAFRGLDGVELAGVFSRTEQRARALATEFGISVIASSVEDLYEQTRADLVVVTVRELAMSDIAKQCFRHDWVSLLEKPAGYNMADARGILHAAHAAQARAFVGLNRRFYGSTLQGCQLLNQRNGGQRHIFVQDQQDLGYAASLGEPTEVLRNYMFANSIHLVDYIRIFARGKVRDVRVLSPWRPQQPGTVIGYVEFDSGDTALYEATWNGPGPWAVAVTDSQTRVEMRPLESLTLQVRGERRAKNIDVGALDSEFKPGLRMQAQRAIEAVRQNRDAGLATLEDATESMDLCARIYDMYD